MQLAADPIAVEIAGQAYEVRPTLRAATRLARRYGDFATLYRNILSDHVTAHLDVVRDGSGAGSAAADLSSAIEVFGVRATLAPLKLPLLRFVLLLSGHDDDEPSKPATGKAVPFADYHAELFAIGTGWLGWTPEATWNATPSEILSAQRGRTDLMAQVLGSIFGKSEEAAPETYTPERLAEVVANGSDPALDRKGLSKLRSLAG